MRHPLCLLVVLLTVGFAQSSWAVSVAPDWGATYQLDLGWRDDSAFFTAYSANLELGHVAGVSNVYEQYSAEEGPVIGGGYGEAQVLLRNGALNGIEPTLRAYIRTGGGHSLWSGGARVRAVEVYDYVGGEPRSVDLDIALHGTYSTAGTMYAYIAAFAGRGVYEPDPQQHALIGSAFLVPAASGETALGTISFILNPGETFTLWTQMALNATGSHEFADALSTLELSFRNPGSLTPRSVVPLPAPAVLLGVGLMVGWGVARRGPPVRRV